MVARWVQVPLSVDAQIRCAARAPGLALWVPHPPRALTILRNSSGARLAHWESDFPADPPCGVTMSPRRPMFATAVQGYTGSGWGDHGWGGGELGAPGWVAGVGVGCGLGVPCRPFPPHGWSAPRGHPLLLRKQPIWAAGDTPHLMDLMLPWHPVATGLAGQAIPCVVSAPHAHALPSHHPTLRYSFKRPGGRPSLAYVIARPPPAPGIRSNSGIRPQPHNVPKHQTGRCSQAGGREHKLTDTRLTWSRKKVRAAGPFALL